MNKAVDPAPFKITRKVAAERRARVIIIVEGFPEADTVATGNQQLSIAKSPNLQKTAVKEFRNTL
jgi:hypothetical protein